MTSSTNPEFWECYRQLPRQIREAARRTYALWRENPRASALRFKKVGAVYSVRIGRTGYRALAIPVEGGFLWFWIGSHDEYLRLLRSL